MEQSFLGASSSTWNEMKALVITSCIVDWKGIWLDFEQGSFKPVGCLFPVFCRLKQVDCL